MIGNVGDTLAVVPDVTSTFTFPDPVNETSARIVAAGVVAQAIAFLVVREGWILIPLVYGFLARVLTGPTLSPLGQFATRFATPRLERLRPLPSRRVPGPPKRFAQAIGLGFTAGASIAWLAGYPGVALTLVFALTVAATLEAVFALCLGCIAYSAIWNCEDCDDIGERLRAAIAHAQRASA